MAIVIGELASVLVLVFDVNVVSVLYFLIPLTVHIYLQFFRSLLGHEDSVTAIKFQHDTHYFFSAGKDGCVKYWDADRFQQILNLPGHFSCVWSLDIPMDGSYCVSGSQDRSLRIWKRSEDLVFIEEERERAFEAQADTSAARDATSAPLGWFNCYIYS